jgi:hypothetical protein
VEVSLDDFMLTPGKDPRFFDAQSLISINNALLNVDLSECSKEEGKERKK